MHSILSYLLVAGLGLLIAYYLTWPLELRHLRPFQLVAIPGLMVLFFHLVPAGGLPDAASGAACFVLIAAMAFILSPNIAFLFSAGLSNFLDPQDWTPAEEAIALRPIRDLIDDDQNREALAGLDKLLQNHKPTYEAILLKAKLLYHIGDIDDTSAALVQLIGLSKTTQQQLAVMELLALLEKHQPPASRPPARGIRRLSIEHELILFPPAANDRSLYKTIPPGAYQVEETLHHDHLWLKLAQEDWGNAEMCWEAACEILPPAPAPPKRVLFPRFAQMSAALAAALEGKPRIHSQAEAQKLLKQANQFIRQDDWPRALPLLQKASACDPDRYEIAYRWAQAVRRTADDAATAKAVAKVLAQSRWTRSEQEMLLQLKRPLPSSKS
jgi:tetratricopeptide (TPR) repeat protein